MNQVHLPLDAYRVVLARPMFAGNLGAVARLLSNFQARDFHVVAPECALNAPEALLFARERSHSFLSSAVVSATLPEATAGCQVAVGFSRRDGVDPCPTISLNDVARLASAGKVALVFGREDSGLSNSELVHCQHLCSIDVSNENPSLNLSHAVAVVLARLYEIHVQLLKPRSEDLGNFATGNVPPRGLLPVSSEPLAPLEEYENLLRLWRTTMVEANLTQQGNPERMLLEIRKILDRSGLSHREIQIFHGFLSSLRRTMGTIKVREKYRRSRVEKTSH